MRWTPKRRVARASEGSSAATHTFEEARQAVLALSSDSRLQLPEDGDVEAEAVLLCSPGTSEARVPAISLRWRQAQHEFGLLMPLDRLVVQAGDLDGVPFYLALAVKEPHGGSTEPARTWFTDLPWLPSGFYD